MQVSSDFLSEPINSSLTSLDKRADLSYISWTRNISSQPAKDPSLLLYKSHASALSHCARVEVSATFLWLDSPSPFMCARLNYGSPERLRTFLLLCYYIYFFRHTCPEWRKIYLTEREKHLNDVNREALYRFHKSVNACTYIDKHLKGFYRQLFQRWAVF